MTRAVSSKEWSHSALQRVASSGQNVQQLFGELESALQLSRESSGTASKVARTERLTSDATIGLTGQDRFKRRQYRHPPARFNSRKSPLDIAGCFNCDDKDHMARDCPKSLNLPRAAERKIEYLMKKSSPNAIHQVHADICMQTTETLRDGADEDDEENATETFRELITTCLTSGKEDENDGEIRYVSLIMFASNIPTATLDTVEHFAGACVDSGAQLAVIGKSQAALYIAETGGELKAQTSDRIYKVGDKRYQGLEIMTVRIPVFEAHVVDIPAKIVDIAVPLPLGLDVRSQLKTVLDFDDSCLIGKSEQWKVPLTRKNGHLHVEWETNMLYFEGQLRHVHRHFRIQVPKDCTH